MYRKIQKYTLRTRQSGRILALGLFILLNLLIGNYGRDSTVSAAIPTSNALYNSESGDGQNNADKVKSIVDKVLLKEAAAQGNTSSDISNRLIPSFGGYYYEGDSLVILVTNDDLAGTIELALASIDPAYYKIQIVPHSLRDLSIEVEKVFQYYQAEEASIDIARNALVLGFDTKTINSMSTTPNNLLSWNGIPVYIEESNVHRAKNASRERQNITALKTQKIPNVRVYDYNYEGIHTSSNYELWAGDGIGPVIRDPLDIPYGKKKYGDMEIKVK